ncbi:response regulator transcription factor [Acidipila sp. EB88]|uniref:response regulator transcription factor n=1 Tax=Acidipila sp. EB88 TaxID=2305226 RepID=UPI000F5E16F0|nr:response regulator transcription factor [Acidipila sp. EB88]RRA47123.1 DNA-binding response regulator [Acidipila sp. EB88]
MSTTAPALNTPSRILVVEDELHLAEGLLFNLQAEGYEVELAHDGETALTLLTERPPFDAVLLDVMLPGINGFAVTAALRSAGNFVPVLMLTARGRTEDVLGGLQAGADDYLAKPFDLNILLARLHVLLRRMQWQRPHTEGESAGKLEEPPPTFEFSGRVIDFSQLELEAKGQRTRLTLMEADFLRYLSEHPLRIIPRKELLEQVWRVHEDTDTRAIDNFVVRLRRYIEDEPANPVYLKTVRGVGYRFLPNGE